MQYFAEGLILLIA